MTRHLPLLLLMLNACAAQHVYLAYPPPYSATHIERTDYYAEHKPVDAPSFSQVQVYGSTTTLRQGTRYLQLANGARVYWAEDLQPLVEPSSVAGIAIANYLDLRMVADIWGWVGIGGLALSTLGVVVGTAMILVTLPQSISGMTETSRVAGQDLHRFNWMYPLAIGGGASLLGSIVSGLGIGLSMLYSNEAQDERETALATYDCSLLQRLDLESETCP